MNCSCASAKISSTPRGTRAERRCCEHSKGTESCRISSPKPPRKNAVRESARERSLTPGPSLGAPGDLAAPGKGDRRPPEFTEVVYVYRNLANRLRVEYREMLLSDLRARFGSFPLPRYLEPDLLRRIFGG